MKIGISGASGKLGTATVAALKARAPDAEVVAISRTPEKLQTSGVETRFGDFDKPLSLDTAFASLDRLLLIPSTDLRPGVRAEQGREAIQRAVDAGVDHIVLMSSLGTKSAGTAHLLQSYFAPEQALFAAARKWTVLRMAYFAESFAEEIKTSRHLGAHASISATPVNFVARDDVAAAAAGILASEGHHGAIYQATGAASFDGPARARLVSNALGKPFTFARVTPDQYREGLAAAGLPSFVIDTVMNIQDMWESGAMNVTTGDIERLTGTEPRALEDILRRELG